MKENNIMSQKQALDSILSTQVNLKKAFENIRFKQGKFDGYISIIDLLEKCNLSTELKILYQDVDIFDKALELRLKGYKFDDLLAVVRVLKQINIEPSDLEKELYDIKQFLYDHQNKLVEVKETLKRIDYLENSISKIKERLKGIE
jgi:hypothetical protein